MLFRSFGPLEIGLIILLVIVLFGVGKLATGLPQLGKGLGQAVGEFKSTAKKKEDEKSKDAAASEAVSETASEETKSEQAKS